MIIKNTYEYQKGILLNRSEELTRFKDSIFKINDGGKDFVSYNKLNNNKSKAPRFTICEFEESLQNCIDFHDLLTVQSNLLDNGLFIISKSFLSTLTCLIISKATSPSIQCFFSKESWINLFS